MQDKNTSQPTATQPKVQHVDKSMFIKRGQQPSGGDAGTVKNKVSTKM